MTRYVLGVDAGGTKTIAVIVDETGKMLGVGNSGAGNPDGVGTEAASRSMHDAIKQACATASGVTPSVVFAGVAGVLSEYDRRLTRGVITSALNSPSAVVEVDHDGRVALAGGLTGREGLVLIAGTGAFCFGRMSDGREWHSSGWGSLFGDEGSAYWVASEAVRAALRAVDGRGEPTELQATLFERLEITSADDLLGRAGRGEFSRSRIAALAPVVVETAEREDVVALDIVGRAADELALSVAAVAQHLGLNDEAFWVAVIGGLSRSELLLSTLRDRVASLCPTARLVEPQLPPVLGAALLAETRLHGLAAPTQVPVSIIHALLEAVTTL